MRQKYLLKESAYLEVGEFIIYILEILCFFGVLKIQHTSHLLSGLSVLSRDKAQQITHAFLANIHGLLSIHELSIKSLLQTTNTCIKSYTYTVLHRCW